MVRTDRGRICIVLAFVCMVSKNPKTPNLSPMANDAITRGGLGLGSPMYICAFYTGADGESLNIVLIFSRAPTNPWLKNLVTS